MGNSFDCPHDSLANAVFTETVLQAVEDNMEKKEVDMKCFVLLNFRHKIIQPKLYNRPFLFGSFTKGILYQVAKETYVAYVTFLRDQSATKPEYLPQDILYQIYNSDNLKIAKAGHAMVIVRKGEIIPSEGIKKIFYIKLPILKYDWEGIKKIFRYVKQTKRDINRFIQTGKSLKKKKVIRSQY